MYDNVEAHLRGTSPAQAKQRDRSRYRRLGKRLFDVGFLLAVSPLIHAMIAFSSGMTAPVSRLIHHFLSLDATRWPAVIAAGAIIMRATGLATPWYSARKALAMPLIGWTSLSARCLAPYVTKVKPLSVTATLKNHTRASASQTCVQSCRASMRHV